MEPAHEAPPTTVAIVGAGRVGTALGVLLERAGYRVVAASGRDASRERVQRHLPNARFTSPAEAARAAELVIVAVPDDLIASSAEELARDRAVGPGQTVIHVSGSTGLDALDAVRASGARVLALHPLQAFPDVDSGIERLPGSGIALTSDGDERALLIGERLARDLGGRPFRLADDVKALYHAAAVFCSNYLVTVEGLAERAMRAAGIADPLSLLEPLARQALDRAYALGPGAALTGPAARGDLGTLERNLQALADGLPIGVEPYVALGRAAARLAHGAGRLSEADRVRVEEVLDRWT